jgi:tRNA threonylcarbamoyladenosine biosynthesis protein TsaB
VGPHVLAAIDARMNEVYVGRFRLRDGDAIAIGIETIAAPDAVVLPEPGGEWRGVGTGFSALDGALQRHWAGRLTMVAADALPHAADVARLAAKAYQRGDAVTADRVEPAYLRNNVALTIAEQQLLRDSRG